MTIRIALNEEQMQWCMQHAKKTYEYRESIRAMYGIGEYSHNTINGALIGIKCEVASSLFLGEDFEVEDHYDSSPTIDAGDFKVNGHCIEVKGLKNRDWDRYKRQIPPIQLDKYVTKNAIVIWATAENHELPRNIVLLRGWNYSHEIKEKGQYIKTICHNVWLKDDEHMCDMADLIRVLKNEENEVIE